MKRIFSAALASILLLSCGMMTACKDEAPDSPSTTEPPVAELSPVGLSEFTIVRPAALAYDTQTAFASFCDVLTQNGAELPVKADSEAADSGALELLIGMTDRAASKDALELLTSATGGENYVIRFDGKKIAILGKDNTALWHALRRFLDDYVIPGAQSGGVTFTKEFTVLAAYDPEVTVLPNLTAVSVPLVSTVEPNIHRWSTYGRVIELKYNGEHNGTLLATSQWAGESFPIYQSTNGGKNWKFVSTASEELTPGLVGNWQPHLYELPCKVGDMPAGTLLLSGCSHDSDMSATMQISIWRSFDLGKTWEQYTIVDTGKGLSSGMYEPFLICDEDGSLVCFYSDETEVSQFGGQRLVLRVSKDGKTWGEKKYCVSPDNRALRPGMVSVAKMGDHGYLIVYEMIGQQGGPVYYKTSKSLTEWEDANSLGKLVTTRNKRFTGCTPYCEWTPAGGPLGTVIAAGRFGSPATNTSSDLFVSFDLGETWYTIEAPLEFDYAKESGANYAYSFGFFTGSDGSIYYINNVFPNNASQKYEYCVLKFAKINLSGYASYPES